MKYPLLLAGLLLLGTFLSARADNLDTGHNTDDWSRVAAESRYRDLPVLMLITSAHCGHCARLKEEFLVPLHRDGHFAEQALIYEFDQDTGGKITDFDGERIRARLFLKRYEVFATPTAVLVDTEGRILTPPLVGYSDADDYGERLEQLLTEAATFLAGTDRADSAMTAQLVRR